jgi:hypothetical protein
MTAPIDFDYAPTDYRDVPSPVSALLLNVKGDLRRRLLRDLLTGAGTPGVDPSLWSESTPDIARGLLGRVHPQWMGGEHLPDYLAQETEIARITLANVTRDVISVRARHRSGRYRYRVVDEYGARWRLLLHSSVRPLPLRSMLLLIDTACLIDARWPDLTDELRDAHGGEPAEAAAFVEVTSDFYPHMERHYAAKANAWLERRVRNLVTGDLPMVWNDTEDGDDEPWAR